MDIKNLIGEATEYDKKEAVEIKKPKSWCKSVSAFANGDGGCLIFGINDDGSVTGLVDAESDAEKISEIIKSRLDPTPEFRLYFENVEDKTVIVLDVKAGNDLRITIPQMVFLKHIFVSETKALRLPLQSRSD